MSNRRKGQPRLSREERRVQLLDAAVEAIRTIGPQASMEQLAAQGGVTKPILYRHFGDRDGLARAIGERYAAILFSRLGDTLAQADPEAMLRGTIDAYLSFLEDEPQLYAFLTSPSSGRGSLSQATAIVDAVARQVAVAIGDQLRSLGLDAGGAEPYAFGIVGMVHQAGDWWIGHRTMSRTALTTYLAGLLWSGFESLAADIPSAEADGRAATDGPEALPSGAELAAPSAHI